MGIIVSKFGGSSMADAQMFAKVRDIVADRNRRQYIVLSAPGKRNRSDQKITDLLCLAHRLYSSGTDGSPPLDEVRSRFSAIIQSLRLNIDPDLFMQDLEDNIRASLDLAASRGEYLCARLFSIYTGIPFVDATEIIHFDSSGRIRRDEIRRAVSAMINRYPCAVIPGFYGRMPDGSIKTFTRGGSDITGALIAAAADADIYENWTDVDGLMSIDPAISEDAVCHPAVSYRQMRLLAHSGARILHPYCVEPVCEAGIPTVLKNTFSPEKPGTYISDHVRNPVSCVCAQEGFSAQYLDLLDPFTQKIINGLPAEKYTDGDGREVIAFRNSNPNSISPAAIVSVYGLPEKTAAQSNLNTPYIAKLKTEHSLKFIIRPKFAQGMQKELHSLLLTESRTHAIPVESFHPSR